MRVGHYPPWGGRGRCAPDLDCTYSCTAAAWIQRENTFCQVCFFNPCENKPHRHFETSKKSECVDKSATSHNPCRWQYWRQATTGDIHIPVASSSEHTKIISQNAVGEGMEWHLGRQFGRQLQQYASAPPNQTPLFRNEQDRRAGEDSSLSLSVD